MPQWRFRVHRWEATAEAVYTQAGWFNQERRVAPVSRIQTVDSERGPFEQLFGITKVTITTASAAGPLTIHGLDQDTAAGARSTSSPPTPRRPGRTVRERLAPARPAHARDPPGRRPDPRGAADPGDLRLRPERRAGPADQPAASRSSSSCVGMSHWFTTTYRIGDGQVELRTGLLRRRHLAVPLDRVRSVDVTASPMHRLLGVAIVKIGTGRQDKGRRDELRLDAVSAHEAQAPARRAAAPRRDGRRCRRWAGHVPDRPLSSTSPPYLAFPTVDPAETVLSAFDPAWIRFAPFTLSGLATVGAVTGYVFHLLNEAHIDPERVGSATQHGQPALAYAAPAGRRGPGRAAPRAGRGVLDRRLPAGVLGLPAHAAPRRHAADPARAPHHAVGVARGAPAARGRGTRAPAAARSSAAPAASRSPPGCVRTAAATRAASCCSRPRRSRRPHRVAGLVLGGTDPTGGSLRAARPGSAPTSLRTRARRRAR